MVRLGPVLIAVMASIVAILVPPKEAQACTLVVPSDAQERLRSWVDQASVVLVGRVTAEHSTSGGSVYASTIHPVVTLKGQGPSGEFRLSPPQYPLA